MICPADMSGFSRMAIHYRHFFDHPLRSARPPALSADLRPKRPATSLLSEILISFPLRTHSYIKVASKRFLHFIG